MYAIRKYKLPFLVIILYLCTGYLFAQEDKSNCVIKLNQAQKKYAEGRIQDIESLILQCIKEKKFDKAEKIQGLKLLTLSYIFLEETDKANQSMLNLLKESHEFEINKAIDPSEFINLYAQFRHDPIFNIGLSAGMVFASPIVTQIYSTQDLNDENRQVYTNNRLGLGFGFFVGFKFLNKINTELAVHYSILNFNKVDGTTKLLDSSKPNGGFEGSVSQQFLKFPILVYYHIFGNKYFKPYVSAGIAPQILLSAEHPGDEIAYALQGSADVTSSTIILTDERNKYNLSAVASAGIKIKVGESFLNIQVRYCYEVFPSTKKTNKLSPQNPNLLWELQETPDKFRLHSLGLSVGYAFNKYKPKKL